MNYNCAQIRTTYSKKTRIGIPALGFEEKLGVELIGAGEGS